jgi:hypothetical protein
MAVKLQAGTPPAEAEQTAREGTNSARMAKIGLWLAIGVFLLLAQRVFVYAPDDAFITYRYAYNLAHGQGPVFNPGAPAGERTEGFSCPLYMLLMAVLHRLPHGMSVLLLAKFLGVACGVALLILTQKLAARLSLPPWAQAMAPLLLAVFPSFAIGSIDGMETMPQALLVTLGALLFVHEWQREAETDRPAGVGSAWAFAACALNRPEGLLLGLIALGTLLVGKGSRRGRRETRWLLTFLLPVAAYFLWRHSFYGVWMPNTYFAKKTPLEYALVKGGNYLGRTFFPFLNENMVYLALAAAWWTMILAGVFSTDRFRRPPLLLVPLLALGQIVFAVRAGGDWMAGWRYMIPALPLLMLLTTAGLTDIAEGVRGQVKTGGATLAAATVGGLCAVYLTACGLGCRDFWANTLDGYRSWASVGFTFDQRALLRGHLLEKAVLIGDWLNAHLSPGAVVAYSEMGVTPYLCPQLRFLDVDGLTDHGVATLPGANHEQMGVHENYTEMTSAVGPYLVNRRKPDYILRGAAVPLGVTPLSEPALSGAYSFFSTFPIPHADPGMQGFMAVWKRAR